jgi:hypothetical protein
MTKRKLRVLTVAQRAFVRLVVEGKTHAEAYRIAAGKQHVGDKNAWKMGARWAQHPGMAAAIETMRLHADAEATKEVAAKLAITKEYVMRSLHEVAERCMQHRPVLDKQGKQVYVETPDGEQAPAYVFDGKGAVNALVPLGKELGMFMERKEVRHGPLPDVPDARLPAMLSDLVAEIRELTGQTVAEVLRDMGMAGMVEAATDATNAAIQRAASAPTPQGGEAKSAAGPIT